MLLTKETNKIINYVLSARILRGLRLAARLNFSFSKETEDAIHNLSSSIAGLEKVIPKTWSNIFYSTHLIYD